MICVLLECRMAFVAFLNCRFLPEAACARARVCVGAAGVSVCVLIWCRMQLQTPSFFTITCVCNTDVNRCGNLDVEYIHSHLFSICLYLFLLIYTRPHNIHQIWTSKFLTLFLSKKKLHTDQWLYLRCKIVLDSFYFYIYKNESKTLLLHNYCIHTL